MPKIINKILTIISVFWLWTTPVLSQSGEDIVWVQIEAHPSLRRGIEAAQKYAAELEDVNGFFLGAGWYAITLGPYRRTDASQVLRAYRRDGLIPNDSYLVSSQALRQQFWPVGANILGRNVIANPTGQTQDIQTDTRSTAQIRTEQEHDTQLSRITRPVQSGSEETVVVEETNVPDAPDETVAQARRSENALSREQKRDLQRQLKWAGFYEAKIDGAFGRGTRRSMRAWQEANGHAPTGVLTTLQRKILQDQYNAILDGLGMKTVRDEAAGIEIKMPTREVRFEKYESPFAHYAAAGPLEARVLLISQSGNKNTLYGLYDIMQTLEIVPLDGPRKRNASGFVLVGENDKIISETRARLVKGQIKGFTLIWPVGDEKRRQRVVAEMDNSLRRLPAVLPETAGSIEDQAPDLLAGLEIRKPESARSGFYIDDSGTVITAAKTVENCDKITIDDQHEADLTAVFENGVAVVTPKETLAPFTIARFSNQTPLLGSQVAAAGYSYMGVLPAASVTFGQLTDLRGLRGEEHLNRLTLNSLSGDAGGPVLDVYGGVLGMLIPQEHGATQLPPGVSFSLDRQTLQASLQAARKSGRTLQSNTPLPAEDLAKLARDMTVLVSCWK